MGTRESGQPHLTLSAEQRAERLLTWLAALLRSRLDADDGFEAKASHELELLGVHFECRLGADLVVVGESRTGVGLPELVRPADIERALKLGPGKARRMAESGEIPSVMLPDGQLRFDVAEVRGVLSRSTSCGDQPRQIHSPTDAARECSTTAAALRELAEAGEVPHFFSKGARTKQYWYDLEPLQAALLQRIMQREARRR